MRRALGIFLLVCVVALCLGSSSYFLPCSNEGYSQQKNSSAEQRAKENCTSLDYIVARSVVSFAGTYPNEISAGITALATAIVAWFTATIWLINRSQLIHGRQVERAYVSGGGAPGVEEHDLGTETTESPMIGGGSRTRHLGIERRPTGAFVVCVNNYGKTPAELQWVGIGFCEAEAIPESPSYRFVYRWDWIQPGDRGRPVFPVGIPKNTTVVYGRFYYLDIFGGRHSSGFINEIGMERNRSDPIPAPAAYTEERNETEESWPRPRAIIEGLGVEPPTEA